MAKAKTFIRSRQTPKSQEEYLASLDPLLRRNTGSFTNIGAETSSNVPFLLPNAIPEDNPSGIGASPSTPQTPTINARTYTTLPTRRSGAADFFDKIRQQNAPQPIGTTEDGGTIYDDGRVLYQDGSIGDVVTGQKVTLVQDFGTGRALYSDGSIRSLGTELQVLPSQGSMKAGASGIASALFPSGYYFTQGFAENPNLYGYGARGHRGVDVGSTFEKMIAPVSMQVLSVEDYGNYGWGKSMVVQLPSGEILRLSHLSDLPYERGAAIKAGEYIATTGDTGNSSGPHIDIEYYASPEAFNAGMYSDPNEFRGFNLSKEENEMLYGFVHTGSQGELIPEDSAQPYEKYKADEYKTYNIQGNQRPEQDLGRQEAFGNTVKAMNQMTSSQDTDIPSAVKNALEQASKIPNFPINTVSQVVDRGMTAGTQVAEAAGRNLNAPEFRVGEGSRPRSTVNPYGFTSGNKPINQSAGNFIDTVSTAVSKPLEMAGLNIPDTGISERVAGASTPNTGRVSGMKSPSSMVGIAFDAANVVKKAGASVAPLAQIIDSGKDSSLNLGAELRDKANSSIQGIIKSSLDTAKSISGLPGVFSPKMPTAPLAVGQAKAVEGDAKSSPLSGSPNPTVAVPTPDEVRAQTVVPSRPTSATEARSRGMSKSYGGDMKPTTTPQVVEQPEQPALQVAPAPKSELELRLEQMAKEGKTMGNDTKYAKLKLRYLELRKKYKEEAAKKGYAADSDDFNNYVAQKMAPATKTGYSDPATDAKAQIARKVKQAFYKGGFGTSFESFLKKKGIDKSNLQAAGKAVSKAIQKRWNSGAGSLITSPGTREAVGKYVTNKFIEYTPYETRKKVLDTWQTVHNLGKNLYSVKIPKQVVKAATQAKSTRSALQDYAAARIPYSAVAKITALQKKLKNPFKR